jgi:ATP adenylyltransferase
MKRLWTPWRMKYLESKRPEGCVFCNKIAADEDRANHILYRGRHACVMLNLYPYNSGHLMVIPYAHASQPADLDMEVQTEMLVLINKCIEVLRRALKPEGFNIGVNLGRAAGAGIDEHVHVHAVPRWNGDTNYMAILAETRVVPEWLDDTYTKLKPIFDAVMG